MCQITEKYHAKVVIEAIVTSEMPHLSVCVSENMYKLVVDAVDETSTIFEGKIMHIKATMSLNKTDKEVLE